MRERERESLQEVEKENVQKHRYETWIRRVWFLKHIIEHIWASFISISTWGFFINCSKEPGMSAKPKFPYFSLHVTLSWAKFRWVILLQNTLQADEKKRIQRPKIESSRPFIFLAEMIKLKGQHAFTVRCNRKQIQRPTIEPFASTT